MNSIHDSAKIRENRCISASDSDRILADLPLIGSPNGAAWERRPISTLHRFAHHDHTGAAFGPRVILTPSRSSNTIYRFLRKVIEVQRNKMNLRLLSILSLAVSSTLLADEASHREAANRILEVTKACLLYTSDAADE